MLTTRKPVMSLYVDKGCPEHWIVRDREGRFWPSRPVRTPGRSVSHFSPARMLNSNRFPAITCTCSVCRPDFHSKPDPALPA